jgi:hypothetical protein
MISGGTVSRNFCHSLRIPSMEASASSSSKAWVSTERTRYPCWMAACPMACARWRLRKALFVSGETRDPRKAAPIALLVALTTATFLYVSVDGQLLPNPAREVLPTIPGWESTSQATAFSQL